MNKFLTFSAWTKYGQIYDAGQNDLQKIEQPNHSTSPIDCQWPILFPVDKYSINFHKTNVYIFSYVIKGAICALSLCDQNFSRKTAFAYLEDIANEFNNQYATQVGAATRPYHFLEFGFLNKLVNPQINNFFRQLYSNNKEAIFGQGS